MLKGFAIENEIGALGHGIAFAVEHRGRRRILHAGARGFNADAEGRVLPWSGCGDGSGAGEELQPWGVGGDGGGGGIPRIPGWKS